MKTKQSSTVSVPTYSINLNQDENGFWNGKFLRGDKVIFDTGIPNSFTFVAAKLTPWLEQAPWTPENL